MLKSPDIDENKREIVQYLVNIFNIENWRHNYISMELNNCMR